MLEILNHPRMLRCVDEYQIEILPSLRSQITTPSNACAGFEIISFTVVLMVVVY
jgi:hypothetical protein